MPWKSQKRTLCVLRHGRNNHRTPGLLQAGDHIIITDDCYKRTREFVESFFDRYGVSCTTVPMGNIEAIETAITPKTRILISETPTNPYLRVADIDQLVQLAK